MTIVGLGPHGERASPPERVTLLPQDIETARTKKLRVAIVMHTVTSDWAKHLVQGIVGLLGECGAIVIEVVDCAFSSDVQIAALNRLREEAPDAIISLPVDNTTVADAHRAISRTGIKLVLIDFFAANEREIAFIHWMEINRPDVTIKTARFASIEHAGKDAERLIDDTSGISGLFVVWDTPCVDVIRKLSKRNLTLPISTVDLGQEVTINLAQGGNIIGISSQRPFQQGETAAKTIITSLLDRGCPDWVALPGLKVSSSNVIESYQFIWRKPAPMDILSGLNITKTK